ncbi:MAG TPA: response regulator [Bacteroidia bacterium]|nr:response regulator [Bacteroidia bacterium]
MKTVNCILLVDDNPAINALHLMTIRNSKICNEIQIAIDGEKALDYLGNVAKNEVLKKYPKPDIIFLDINMPRMNGFEFLEKYEKLKVEMKAKAVVILTTSSNPEDQKKAAAFASVTSFRSKPLTVEMVQEIVNDYF